MLVWVVDEKPSSDQRRVRMPELTEKMLSTARSSAIHFLKLSAYILVELLSEIAAEFNTSSTVELSCLA